MLSKIQTLNKRLSCFRETARRSMYSENLLTAAQLYEKCDFNIASQTPITQNMPFLLRDLSNIINYREEKAECVWNHTVRLDLLKQQAHTQGRLHNINDGANVPWKSRGKFFIYCIFIFIHHNGRTIQQHNRKYTRKKKDILT